MKAKYVLCFLLVLVMVFTLTACGDNATQSGSSGEVRELRVLSFGGAYDDVLTENVKAFEEEHNCKVTFVNAEGSDTLVKINNNEVDLVFTDMIYSMRGEADGLFAPLDEANVPNIAKIYNVARRTDYTVLHDVGAYGIAYNPKQLGWLPSSWNDLWDPDFEGILVTRGFRADSIELMVWAAKQRGGDERNIDPGFEAMGELAANVNTFASDHSQILQLFQGGDVSLGVWTDGRVSWAQKQGAPVKFNMPDEGAFLMATTINVAKNSPNLDLAYAYVNMELGADAQANMGDDLGYFPMNRDAYDKMASETTQNMAFTPDSIEKAQMADWAYIETVYDQWAERWEKEVVAKAK